ncbi:FtsK/SpoIIIE domain-containing protein [Nesterenkonia sp. CF4.4]|uniref:FtsK/SpoIIIE domain-containing protein n=1 Tax=Nesterenkonia sp. CF4.4 TaxID=3373079 RepID=UPI003EE725C9
MWNRLRIEAGGTHPHELRILLDGAAAPSGAQIDDALGSWIRSVSAEPPLRARLSGGAHPSWVAVLDGTPLKEHAADSPSIHHGMVVVLHTSTSRTVPSRSAPPLRLCISAGPDSGWMVRLPRGVHMLGRGTRHRGTADIRINDPHLERSHATIRVSKTQVQLARPGTAPTSLNADAPVRLGRSRVELVQEPPPPVPQRNWPLPPAKVTEQPPSGRHRTMLLVSLAPLAVGVVLVLVTGMWIFLLFSAASAVLAVITLLDGRRRRRRFRRSVRAASIEWADQRRALFPTPGRAVRALRARARPRSSLGLHDPGGVVVTVGEARIDAELDCPGESGQLEALDESRVLTATAWSLLGSEHTVLSGSPREQLSVLRWILAQLTHHVDAGPHVLLAPDLESLGRARACDVRNLLDPTELRDYRRVGVVQPPGLEAALRDRSPGSPSTPAPVLISPVPLDSGPVRTALGAGWHVISTSGSDISSRPAAPPPARQMPPTSADGWRVNLDAGELHRIESGTARRVATGLVPDGLSRQTLHEHLRLGLRHVSGSGTDTGVPPLVTASLPSPLMPGNARLRLETLLGQGSSAEELLDLVADGPHILLAGTTGAGKSELLKSMLLGWAARYGPRELNLLLFDFKGGSSFQHLARLEHTVGLVTDLTKAQSDRTLEGLQSELTRRERLFLESGVADYADFRRARPAESLARMLVVIDEFRIFTQTLPGAMDELMRLATLGRSLGLHLILATQRPQGAVTADIRANIGTIICLRLRSEEEARDLVGTTEPAHLPRQLPGRGIIQRPGETARPFQAVQLLDRSAKITARAERVPAPPAIGWRDSTPALVEALERHLRVTSSRRAHTPLCPPLPEILRAPLGATEIQFGLIDDPARQTQRPLRLNLNGGAGTAVLGETASGGTAALQSMVRQLLAHPSEVHVYLLDGDHCLEEFRHHPRIGSWVTTDHLQEAQYLITQLHRLVTRRRTSPPPERIPLVLVMSGHSRWQRSGSLMGGGDLESDLGLLTNEGAGFGFSMVVVGGRELALGKLGSRLTCKVYLPYGVSEEVRYLWPKLRATDPLPGRGVLVSADEPLPGLSVQLVTGVLEQRTEPPVNSDQKPLSPTMLRVDPLPLSVGLPVLGSDSTTLSLGLHQFTHSPATLEDSSWQAGLILGAAQTGKTNALRLVAAQRHCWTLADLAVAGGSGNHTEEAATLLLIDDAERCTPAQHRSIEAWLESGGKVLATALPQLNVFSRLPWSYRARGGAANFVLSPLTRSQGEAFGLSVPTLQRHTPGRAVWIGPEGPRIIQWWKHPESA